MTIPSIATLRPVSLKEATSPGPTGGSPARSRPAPRQRATRTAKRSRYPRWERSPRNPASAVGAGTSHGPEGVPGRGRGGRGGGRHVLARKQGHRVDHVPVEEHCRRFGTHVGEENRRDLGREERGEEPGALEYHGAEVELAGGLDRAAQLIAAEGDMG